MFAENIHYHIAFLAGITSFFTPCVLPLIPAYFSFITGFTLDDLVNNEKIGLKQKTIISTFFFVLGFSVIFIMLGASASFLGGFFEAHKDIIRIIGGIVIIILGIHFTGLFRIKILNIEKRIHIKKKPMHIFGAFIIGMAFGAGWSPCIGPILGSILIIAGHQKTIWHGIGLLAIYSAGLAIPFILISFFINYLLSFLAKAKKAMKYINYVSGGLLICVGILLLTNKLML